MAVSAEVVVGYEHNGCETKGLGEFDYAEDEMSDEQCKRDGMVDRVQRLWRVRCAWRGLEGWVNRKADTSQLLKAVITALDAAG